MEDPDPGDSPSFPTCLGIAGVDDESMEPGLEALRIAQGRQVALDTDERLLRRILCAMRVPEDPVGEGVAAIDGLRRQGCKGILVTADRALHELGLHVRLRSSCGPSGRFTEYGAGRMQNVQ